MHKRLIFSMVLTLTSVGLAVRGQMPEITQGQIDEAVDLAWDLGEAWQRGDLPDFAFTPAEFQKLATELQSALESNQLDDLASFQTIIPKMMAALSETESGRHYVAWLLQRYDYAVVAGWAREEAVMEVEKAATAPQPAQIRKFQDEYVTDLRVWQHRISERQIPRPAPGLVPQLRQIFSEKGISPALIWLAEVESSFDPAAISPVGAKGLFQFMPATAEWMGLELRPEDERVNATKSASAAADYLRYLFGRFESWPLVFAAYNAGEGRVRRLMKEHSAIDFNGIASALPSETRMYVPKVLATIQLREGVDPRTLPAPTGENR